MKALQVLSIAAIAAILFSGCSKDDAPVDPVLNNLQKKWNFHVEFYHENYFGVEYRDTTYALPGAYADFRTDNKVYTKIYINLDTFSYSLLNNNKLIISKAGPIPFLDTLSISVLNETDLQLYSKKWDPAPNYYEYTQFFTKF